MTFFKKPIVYFILVVVVTIIIGISRTSAPIKEVFGKIVAMELFILALWVLVYIYRLKTRKREEQIRDREKQIKNILAKKRYDLIAALIGYVHERVCDYQRFDCSDPVALNYQNLKAFFADEGVDLTSNEVLQLNNAAAREWGMINFSPKEWEEKIMKGFFGEIKDEHLKLIDGFIKRQMHEDIVDEVEFNKFIKLLYNEQCSLSRQELMTFFTFRMYREMLVKFDLIAEKAKKQSLDAILPDIMFYEGDELEGSINLLSDALQRHGFKPEECTFEIISGKLEKHKQKSELDKYKSDLLTGKPHISIEAVDLMDGTQFERFLEELFKRKGYHVDHRGKTGDQGADLIIEGHGEHIAVQAKCYRDNKVSNDAVQEVVAALKHYHCDKSMVVTNNYFQPGAIELAESNHVELVDRDTLIEWIKKYY